MQRIAIKDKKVEFKHEVVNNVRQSFSEVKGKLKFNQWIFQTQTTQEIENKAPEGMLYELRDSKQELFLVHLHFPSHIMSQAKTLFLEE